MGVAEIVINNSISGSTRNSTSAVVHYEDENIEHWLLVTKSMYSTMMETAPV